MPFICVECGKEIGRKETKGSMRHPYCKKCFKRVFNNDYEKYRRFLQDIH